MNSPGDFGNHPRVLALIEQFRRVDASMRELPIYNDKVAVEAIGFGLFGDGALLGVMLTPWFMNLIILPIEPVPMNMAEIGKTVPVELPAGQRTFVVGGDEFSRALQGSFAAFAGAEFHAAGSSARRGSAHARGIDDAGDGRRNLGNKRSRRQRRRSARAAIRPAEPVKSVGATDQTRPITSPVPISPIMAPQACMTRRRGASSNQRMARPSVIPNPCSNAVAATKPMP